MRIPRMGEGTVFSLSVHTSTRWGGGGGVPIPADGEGGYPMLPNGGKSILPNGGWIPHLADREVPPTSPNSWYLLPIGGYPIWLMGVPPIGTGSGVPDPYWDWMGVLPSCQDWMGYPPPVGTRWG